MINQRSSAQRQPMYDEPRIVVPKLSLPRRSGISSAPPQQSTQGYGISSVPTQPLADWLALRRRPARILSQRHDIHTESTRSLSHSPASTTRPEPSPRRYEISSVPTQPLTDWLAHRRRPARPLPNGPVTDILPAPRLTRALASMRQRPPANKRSIFWTLVFEGGLFLIALCICTLAYIYLAPWQIYRLVALIILLIAWANIAGSILRRSGRNPLKFATTTMQAVRVVNEWRQHEKGKRALHPALAQDTESYLQVVRYMLIGERVHAIPEITDLQPSIRNNPGDPLLLNPPQSPPAG